MKVFHISIEVASRIAKRNICWVPVMVSGPGSSVMCVFSCVKSSQQSSGTLCMCVSPGMCVSLICYFHWWILTFSAYYSCAHCQWHEKLHEEIFLHARQHCRLFWGSPLATWYLEAHLRELLRAAWGAAGRKPEFSRLQDWECQLVPEPGQWLLCQSRRWPNLAGITAQQPFPICDIQSHSEEENFYRQ